MTNWHSDYYFEFKVCCLTCRREFQWVTHMLAHLATHARKAM